MDDPWLERVRLRRALSSIRTPIDLLVYSENDVQTRGDWLGTLLYEALREGKDLLEPYAVQERYGDAVPGSRLAIHRAQKLVATLREWTNAHLLRTST